jgi:hypothetical protein
LVDDPEAEASHADGCVVSFEHSVAFVGLDSGLIIHDLEPVEKVPTVTMAPFPLPVL